METPYLHPDTDVYISDELKKFEHLSWCSYKVSLMESMDPKGPCMCFGPWLDLSNRNRDIKISGKDLVMWYKLHKHDGKVYHYFMTWTTDPKHSCADTTRKNFNRFLARWRTLGIERVDHVEEHVDSNFHIHACVKSHKTIHAKHILPYQKYGRVDLQKAKGTFEEIIEYMSKENTPTTFYGKIGTMGQG